MSDLEHDKMLKIPRRGGGPQDDPRDVVGPLDGSDLPPGGPILLLAHDLVAALTAGDARRAFGSAAALSQVTSVVFEVLDVDDDWHAAAELAQRRVGLKR